MIEKQILTARETAKYIGITEKGLTKWRSEGKGPKFFRAGRKFVRYRLLDVDKWIESGLSKVEDCRTRPQQLESPA